MNDVALADAPYLRMRSSPGGAVRRWLLHAMLRVGARWQRLDAGRIEEFRRKNVAFDRKFGQLDPALKRSAFDADGVPCEWIDAPESRADRVLFYIHGGAFVLRFPNLHAALAGRWCRRLGSRALMVDYRLAPEHPYPAALDDCVRAYRWLLAQGVDASKVVVAGDSAGGNLSLAMLHRLKAAGVALPRCAVLLSPVVDFTLSSPSLYSNAGRDPMFTFQKLAALRLMYAEPARFLDPTVSPLYGDFTGFPPLLFHAGEIEMLRDESMRAAERAYAAGVRSKSRYGGTWRTCSTRCRCRRQGRPTTRWCSSSNAMPDGGWNRSRQLNGAAELRRDRARPRRRATAPTAVLRRPGLAAKTGHNARY